MSPLIPHGKCHISRLADDGTKEKEQVYKNVKRADQIERSAILTTQESVKSATGDAAAASRAGDEAGRGFRDSTSLIERTRAAQ